MSRLGSESVGTRYSLWGSLPTVYRDYDELLIRRPEAQMSRSSGSELERVSEQLDRIRDEPPFLPSMVEAFDAALAPAHVSIEDLDLYFDPRTCPPDFLPWLSGWLGLIPNERWPIMRRREFVVRATEVFKLRGTLSGIRQAVELYTGITPSVTDSGGTSAGGDPLGPLPGSGEPQVLVTVPAAIDDGEIDFELVHDIIDSVRPAHVKVELRAEK